MLRLLPDGLDTPRGMAARERILYVIHYAPTQSDVAVWEIDPDGLDAEGGFASDLAHVDNDGGVPAALTTPHGMTTLDGRILVLDDGQDELWQLDPNVSNPNLRTLPSGLISPTGVTVLGTRLLVVDNAGDGLWEINADGADGQGTKLRDLPSNLSGPQGMAAYDGTRLLIADNAGDELWEIDPDGADAEGALLRLLPSDLISPLAMVDFPGLPPVIGNAGRTSWATDARDATGAEVAPVSIDAGRVTWTATARGATGSIVPSVGDAGRAGWTAGAIGVAGAVVPPVSGDAGMVGWTADARGVTGRHGPVYGSPGRAGWRVGARGATGSVVQPVTGSAGRASWRTRARRVSGSLGMVDPVNGSAGRAGWRTRTRGITGSLGALALTRGDVGRTGWTADARGASGTLPLTPFSGANRYVGLLMVVEAGTTDLFHDGTFNSDPATGTLLNNSDQDLTDSLAIARVRYFSSGPALILSRRSGDDSLETYYQGAGAALSLTFHTSAGTFTLTPSDVTSVSASRVRYDLGTANRAIVSGLAAGDVFLIALWLPAIHGLFFGPEPVRRIFIGAQLIFGDPA